MKRISKEEINELLRTDNLKSVPEAYDDKKEITISVFCLTYNQEKYIKDALDSFLMQLVNFNVEIVIHDDASTDSTPQILEEYSKRYPKIVKVVFEKENQYSKVGDTIEIERKHIKNANGKYIASCEGDDYWTDPYKLLLQKSILENNQSLNYCAHRVQVFDLLNGNNKSSLPLRKLSSCTMNENEFADLVNEGYPFQTSSYFMNKKMYEKFLDDYPNYARIIPTSDESIMYFFACNGGAIYLDRTMSCWRKFTENSWNMNLIHSSSKEQNERRRKFARGIMEYYHYSGERFPSCIERANRLMITTYLSEGNLKGLFEDKSMRKTLKRQGRIRYYKLKFKSILKGKINK